ncbi:flagellar motor switch protein FliN [Burkholderia sp. BCC1977]|uniref:flagellar motor switch protein FliN n=1 Tax=Burkholderia sp. BCC1977 TaxID=2817440 RepID=UPI002ABD41EB|nr:flagellar motor switch protein FliN [Burkholderia sp. BCC1977]
MTLPEHQPAPLDTDANRPALGLLDDVKVDIDVRLGRATLTVKDMLALQTGAVIELERAVGAPVDVLLNGKPIAHGEIVAVDGNFGVRILGIAPAC